MAERVEEIKALFKKREDTFETLSKEILDLMPNVLEGCAMFVADRGGNAENLEWDNVAFYEDRNVIMLIGSVKHDIGDVVVMPNGMHAEVDAENVEYFKSMLHLGIPFKLVEEASAEDIKNFMDETLDTDEHEIEASDDIDFNLDELTEEQKEKLMMYNPPEGSDKQS